MFIELCCSIHWKVVFIEGGGGMFIGRWCLLNSYVHWKVVFIGGQCSLEARCSLDVHWRAMCFSIGIE